MRYQFGGVVLIKVNLIVWNPYTVGLLELYITSHATCPPEDVRKTANWDSLFDTYKVKISHLNL